MQGVWQKTCTTGGSNYGYTSGIETWNTMRAFAKCCVDYAGPFTTTITRRVSAKRYLCLFACFATRAVHLEMAHSLSTADFLNAFS